MPLISKDDIFSLHGKEGIEQRAYDKGFASGEKAGFKAGEQKTAVLIEQLEKIIEDYIVARENLVKDLELQVVDLAAAIARKIVIEEISIKPEIIVTVVKEALKKLQMTGTITIKVSPAVYDLFAEKKPDLLEIRDGIILDVDPHVSRTGPLVIGQTEEIVTDIENLMTNIIEEMRKTTEPQTDEEDEKI